MTLDIRQISSEDWDRWKYLGGVAFMDPPDVVDRFAKHHRPEWVLGAYVDGDLQASASSAPYAIGLEGSPVRMGGVTSVACMPEYRRKGLVAGLLRETLRRSHAQGEPLSGLWTPHPALYRRYGWEICTDSVQATFNPKHVTLSRPAPPAGDIRRIEVDDWKQADRVYRQWGERRNSVLLRDELRWRMVLEPEHPVTAYVYRSPEGEPEGYAILRPQTGGNSATLQVSQLVAITHEAYTALLGLAISHDLVSEVSIWLPVDEPIHEMFVDPRQVSRRMSYGLFLRLVDVQAAVAARPAYADGRVTMRVIDETCEWNDGTWEVASVGSHLNAERCDDEPMLTLDIRALAQLYNGFRSATNLARAGRLQAHHPRALAVADLLFAMRTPPFCLDDF